MSLQELIAAGNAIVMNRGDFDEVKSAKQFHRFGTPECASLRPSPV